MKRNKYTDGKNIIHATEKAFRLLYKERGFYLCKEEAKRVPTQKSKTNSTGNSRPNRKTSGRKSADTK